MSNENQVIKKLLYIHRPLANLILVNKNYIRYHVHMGSSNIYFHVPLSDIGDAEFKPQMPAQLLNRYIYANDAAIPREYTNFQSPGGEPRKMKEGNQSKMKEL